MNTPIPSVVPVPFHGATLFVTDYDGEPCAPMKPIVEGMGLNWAGQHEKLNGSRFKVCVREIQMQLPGDTQRRPMTCLPLRKLPGWLMSIHPNKVRAELRERIIQYQTECDDVLWQHWNQRAGRTVDEPVGPELIGRVINALGRALDDTPPRLDIDFPVQRWLDENPALAREQFASGNTLNIPARVLFGMDSRSPISALLVLLSRAGYNVDACRIEIMALRHHLEMFDQALDGIQRGAGSRRAGTFRIAR
ncbi:phage antirepressor N-terminal domain-containing protein [Plasticicumulans acidivorans]|uniref:P22-like antirepressor protein n=1 Tax=Plasticicumulans acidivorans TaxID=886464 RepID=A0A317N5G2_9GAMM|nr:phage antirepressor N-terminal domain-containing protein [Plasticicumulans acidivorans]PWV65989.1 P22-like antirepressor protein [Plasticicumulans acidivorans]